MDMWVHHVSYVRELEYVIPMSARVVTVVRSPESRFESAWAVFTSKSVAEGREKGWGMGVYGLTADAYCALAASGRARVPRVFVSEPAPTTDVGRPVLQVGT